MKREIRDEWVRRLESGEYEQGRGYLRRKGEDGEPDRFCCLGILCDMAVEAGIVERSGADRQWTAIYVYTQPGGNGDPNVSGLPGPVMDWADLRRDMNDLGMLRSDSSTVLSSMNDSGVPFAGIADVIKKRVTSHD